MTENSKWLDEIKWNDQGLVPVITQEKMSGKILTLAWINREALQKTVETGRAVYWSRSRNRIWHKGEESGHFQVVTEIRIDCDKDTVLLQVEQAGGIACHTGRHSCFHFRLDSKQWIVVDPVVKEPTQIYRQSHQSGPKT